MDWENLPSTRTPVNATNLTKVTDSGSNANGYYIKYQDGTLIQWGTVDKTRFEASSTYSTTVQGINWYRSSDTSIYFPVEFLNTSYVVTPSIENENSGTRVHIPRIMNYSTARFIIQLISMEQFANNGDAYTTLDYVRWMAVGKWK